MAAHRDPADTLLTDHLRALAAGREPDAREIARVLARIEQLLARELRRRGIWGLPPERLGIVGFRHWWDEGALAELAADAYDEALLRRLRGLFGQLAVKPDVEGLIKTNLKRFLRDLQRRGDPLGHRVWEVALDAAERAVERRTLVVVAAGPPIDARTLLALGREAADRARIGAADLAAGDEDAEAERRESGGAEATGPGAAAAEARRRALAERAAQWNAALLPDLVTARGRGLEAVSERLAERFAELGADGVELFRLREVIAALRNDLRPRWAARLREGAEEVPAGEVRTAGESEPPLPVVRLSAPAADPESLAVEREAARRLVRCVEERLAALPADEQTRREAYGVWRAQVVAAAEGGDRVSERELARSLEIPRDRVPRLVEAVRRAVDGCRRELGLGGGEEEGR